MFKRVVAAAALVSYARAEMTMVEVEDKYLPVIPQYDRAPVCFTLRTGEFNNQYLSRRDITKTVTLSDRKQVTDDELWAKVPTTHFTEGNPTYFLEACNRT